MLNWTEYRKELMGRIGELGKLTPDTLAGYQALSNAGKKTNRLDAKGRVSVPAPFRLVLLTDGFDGLYCCPTLDMQAVDAGGNRLREAIRESLAGFGRFSPEHEYLSTALLGVSEILKLDADGRVTLTESLKVHAGIGQEVPSSQGAEEPQTGQEDQEGAVPFQLIPPDNAN